MSKAKPFVIPKALLWEAWQRVKANKGAAGIDGQTVGEFDADLSKNLYRIWNRMSSGSYFPPAVKAVPIPKKSGGGAGTWRTDGQRQDRSDRCHALAGAGAGGRLP